MGTNAKATKFIQIERFDRFHCEIQPPEAAGVAQFNFLSEASGLIFGLITLYWVISSLCGLI